MPLSFKGSLLRNDIDGCLLDRDLPGGTEENHKVHQARGHAVEHLVKALRYKPEGRGFDS
jgi:hypothetical protein